MKKGDNVYMVCQDIKNKALRSKRTGRLIEVGTVGKVHATRPDGCCLVKFEGHGGLRHCNPQDIEVLDG